MSSDGARTLERPSDPAGKGALRAWPEVIGLRTGAQGTTSDRGARSAWFGGWGQSHTGGSQRQRLLSRGMLRKALQAPNQFFGIKLNFNPFLFADTLL